MLTSPFVRFARLEASGGILPPASTIAALVWANSPWADTYHAIWIAPATLGFGQFALTETRHEWINDGLMGHFLFCGGTGDQAGATDRRDVFAEAGSLSAYHSEE